MLKLHFKDNRHAPLWVVEKLYTIGRATDNQLVLNEEGIDPIHAKLIKDDDKFFLKDNNSSSGCFVNGQRITHKEILPGDILKLGSVEIIVLDPRSLPSQQELERDQQLAPWRLVSDGNFLVGKQFNIPSDRPVVIGRGNQCDIVIPGTHLSRRHTEIMVEGNHLRIKDLGSANGTYLNELRIDNATANNSDRLRLDVYNFRIIAPETDDGKTRVRKPIDELVKPIERKLTSSEPKRWKTRPTSPGNRIEEELQHRTKGLWALLAIAALIAVAIAGFLVSQ